MICIKTSPFHTLFLIGLGLIFTSCDSTKSSSKETSPTYFIESITEKEFRTIHQDGKLLQGELEYEAKEVYNHEGFCTQFISVFGYDEELDATVYSRDTVNYLVKKINANELHYYDEENELIEIEIRKNNWSFFYTPENIKTLYLVRQFDKHKNRIMDVSIDENSFYKRSYTITQKDSKGYAKKARVIWEAFDLPATINFEDSLVYLNPQGAASEIDTLITEFVYEMKQF